MAELCTEFLLVLALLMGANETLDSDIIGFDAPLFIIAILIFDLAFSLVIFSLDSKVFSLI